MVLTHFFSNLVSFLETGATHGGYVFLLIISVLESIPLVGTTVPGHTAVIVSGFLAHIGIFNLWIVIFLASIGAVLGDTIGFYLGRKYGMPLIEKFKFRFFAREEYIEKTRALIGKHTGKALIIGRFNPLTRSLMPFVVGASRAPARTFWIFNAIGGVSWATASVMLGYVFGLGYHAAAGYIGKGLVIAILAASAIVWGYKFVNMRFHIFRRYELFALALNALSLGALAKTVQDAWAVHSYMADFDIWVNQFMAHLTGQIAPIVASIANIISAIGSTAVTAGLGILVGFAFLLKKKWRSGVIMLVSIGSSGVMIELMKMFFLRVRPENALQVVSNDPSFPSGHAALAAAFFVALVYLFTPRIAGWVKRELLIVAGVLAVIAIGVSRLVLNVHWASDVIAGWSLGVFCATATILLVRYLGALVVRKIED
jgi:undecaprenyl-diphosphatase